MSHHGLKARASKYMEVSDIYFNPVILCTMFSKPHPHPVILPKERNQNRAVAKLEWCLHDTCRNHENLSGILAAAHSATFHTAFKVIKSLVELGWTQLIHLAQKDSGYLPWSWCVHERGCHCSVFFVVFWSPSSLLCFPAVHRGIILQHWTNENCLWRMSKTTESKLAPKGFRSQSKLEKRKKQSKRLQCLACLRSAPPTHVTRSSLIIHTGWNEKQTVSLSDVKKYPLR